jgi:Bacterial Ig-like domain
MKRFLALFFTLGLIACPSGSPNPSPTPTPDITAPSLVSRAPANAATNVKLTDEISLSFNEAILASSITDATVQIKNGASVLARTANLDANGTKLIVVLNPTPALPATLTVVINGLTDLAGNAAVVANSSFTVPAVNTAKNIEVVVPSSPVDGLAVKANFKVLMRNFTGSRVKYTKIFLSEKFFAIDDTPNNCPEFCFDIDKLGLTSFDNGAYQVTASVFQEDGTETKTTVAVPLVINIKNFDAPLGWSNGAFVGIDRPAYYNFNTTSYLPTIGPFYSVNTGTNGDTVVEVSKRYPYLSAPRTQTQGLYFKAYIGTTSSSDTVTISARDCKSAQECTVWNTSVIDSSNPQYTQAQLGPPNFGDTASEAAYMEIKLRFDSSSPRSNAYIGNIFVGKY